MRQFLANCERTRDLLILAAENKFGWKKLAKGRNSRASTGKEAYRFQGQHPLSKPNTGSLVKLMSHVNANIEGDKY
jgi:hypothetical protein